MSETHRQPSASYPPDFAANYRRQYNLSPDSQVTEAMMAEHFETEKGYRIRLLAAPPDQRAAVFEACYSELYVRFPWLYQGADPADRKMDYVTWGHLLPQEPQDIYEIGSGNAGLARYLASLGHHVTATEVSSERREKSALDTPGLRWATTDGVHLLHYETAESYSAVISNQVIEHLHPEDLPIHLEHAQQLLRRGGCYILSTPHAAVGPSDIGRVFEADTLVGMHLREYSYAELERLGIAAGFVSASAVLRIPRKVRALLPHVATSVASRRYFQYLKLLERQLASLPTQKQRRSLGRRARAILFSDNLFIVLRKA